MPDESKESVLLQLNKQLAAGRLNDDVGIIYQVQGGVHGEQLNESVTLTATGSTRVQVSDALGKKHSGDVHAELGRETVLKLVRTITAGIDDLIPKSKARFVPDSLVGSVSIGIGDEAETYYFHADDEMALPPGVRLIIDSFGKIEKRCLEGNVNKKEEK